MEIVTTIAPVALALIMLGLGLELTLGDFKRVALYPRDFMIGFICQVFLLPVIGLSYIKAVLSPLPLSICISKAL